MRRQRRPFSAKTQRVRAIRRGRPPPSTRPFSTYGKVGSLEAWKFGQGFAGRPVRGAPVSREPPASPARRRETADCADWLQLGACCRTQDARGENESAARDGHGREARRAERRSAQSLAALCVFAERLSPDIIVGGLDRASSVARLPGVPESPAPPAPPERPGAWGLGPHRRQPSLQASKLPSLRPRSGLRSPGPQAAPPHTFLINPTLANTPLHMLSSSPS